MNPPLQELTVELSRMSGATGPERVDEGLSHQEVECLWRRDPVRAFIEWTYRMNEIQALVDGDVEFARKITDELCRHRPALSHNLQIITGGFENGTRGRAAWQIQARNSLFNIFAQAIDKAEAPESLQARLRMQDGFRKNFQGQTAKSNESFDRRSK